MFLVDNLLKFAQIGSKWLKISICFGLVRLTRNNGFLSILITFVLFDLCTVLYLYLYFYLVQARPKSKNYILLSTRLFTFHFLADEALNRLLVCFAVDQNSVNESNPTGLPTHDLFLSTIWVVYF